MFSEISRLSFRIPNKLLSRKRLAQLNKEHPDESRTTVDAIPLEILSEFRDILIFAVSWSVRWDTRDICVSCIFHRTNGAPEQQWPISVDICVVPFPQDGREYRRLSEQRCSRAGRRQGETGSLSQPLAYRYYTIARISLGNGATLFAANRRGRLIDAMEPARLFSPAINYE